MELSGNLSDFALTDILQILALSRKSGTLALESGSVSGSIVIDKGRIVFASMVPGKTFSGRLVHEGLVSQAVMERLKRIGEEDPHVWTLRSLLLESGLLREDVLEDAARRQIQDVVGALVRIERGKFGIELNQTEPDSQLNEIAVMDGLDIGEVLLGAAKEIDEISKTSIHSVSEPAFALSNGNSSHSNGDILALLEPLPTNGADSANHTQPAQKDFRQSQRASLLFSMLAELRSHSFEAEVSLLIMRYASEVAARGVLFVVKDGEIAGLGQFGVANAATGKSPDERVREIRIPIGANSIFDRVVGEGQPYIGEMPDNYWHSELLKRIGGNGMPLQVFALPLVCNDQPIFVFYGDNFPGRSELSGIDELAALVNQASIVLEKIVLERMLDEIRQSR